MPRIRWIEDDEAEGDVAAIYAKQRVTPSGQVPDIVRTMSLRPDFMAGFIQMSELNFTDGALSRAQHEMIAAYVSALNRCHY
jgi:Carboxymuconolactone decarboxylase family